MIQTCDKRVERAVKAYAREVYDGAWERVTVAELRGIIAAVYSEEVLP